MPNKISIVAIIVLLLNFASMLQADEYDHWVSLKKGETVGEVIYDHFGSPYYGLTLWPKGEMIDLTFEASGLNRETDKNLPVGTRINLGALYKYQALVDAQTQSQEQAAAPQPIAQTIIAPTKSRHRYEIGLYSLHTELASEQTRSFGAGSIADEILSQVRLSATLDYRYKLSKKLSLQGLLFARWYDYSDSLILKILEDQTNVAFRPHIGAIYKASNRLDVGVNVFADQQLFYYGNENTGELFFDLDTTAGVGLNAKYHAFSYKGADFEPYVYGDYFQGFADDVGSGFSIGGGLKVPAFRNKRISLDARYEQKFYDFFSSDVRHEVLEMGLSYSL
jgi:hypothetical protein